jgi:hypothetical protein
MLTTNKLRAFLIERPSLKPQGLCSEALIGKNTIFMALKRGSKLSKKTIEKLLPILKKYGYENDCKH